MKRIEKRVYLDYAASTPVDPAVLKAMSPYFSERFGNAGSLHSYGQASMAPLDKSREVIANAVGAKFNEIIFTSSATEANNLALRGILKANSSKLKAPNIIVSAIEHESILETAKVLERDGVEVVYLPVDKNGLVDLEKLKKSINERTVLVSVMYANNEIGTIQPIAEVAKTIRQYKDKNGSGPVFHTDAVQAFNYLDCDVDNLHVDIMTISSHKIYGPKGAGALYVRNLASNPLEPILTGGGQEFGYRSSTENIPAIVGFAKAAEITLEAKPREGKRVGDLRDMLWAKIKKIYSKAQLNGSLGNRLPNNLNIYVPGVSAEKLLIKLDLAGIAASSGSACKSRALEESYVIKALGYGGQRAKNSLRFTLGRFTSHTDIDKVIKSLKI